MGNSFKISNDFPFDRFKHNAIQTSRRDVRQEGLLFSERCAFFGNAVGESLDWFRCPDYTDSSGSNPEGGAMDRRDFLKSATVAAGAAASNQMFAPAMAAGQEHIEHGGSMTDGMIYRTLGRTGERVSAIGMGGYHLGKSNVEEAEAIRLMHQAIDRGITFFDNCWDYNGGVSEQRMGKALGDGPSREDFFDDEDRRAHKGCSCTPDRRVASSRLQTDHVDLMQFHEVIRLDDPDRIFAGGRRNGGNAGGEEGGEGRFMGSRGTRIHWFTCACWRLHATTSSISMRCRCR